MSNIHNLAGARARAAQKKFGDSIPPELINAVGELSRIEDGKQKKDILAVLIGYAERNAIPKAKLLATIHRMNVDPVSASTDPLEVEAMRTFAEQNHDRLRFNHTRGEWFFWDGWRWQQDVDGEAMRAMLLTADMMRAIDTKARKELGKVRFAENALRGARAMVEFAVTSHAFDTDPYLLGTPSGYVDLRTGILRNPDPSKMISRATSVDPDPSMPAPLWHAFLQEAFEGNEDMIRYMQKFWGYCLSGLMNEEIFTFIHGPGGNGKGVMLKAVTTIMDNYYVNTPAEVFAANLRPGHPTELARLEGARLVTASEPPEGMVWNAPRIKEISGNETPLSARFMRQNFFEFWAQFKLVLVANTKPAFENVEKAITRRLRAIPMTFIPKEPDTTLKDRMRAEYPAILRWMIEGFLAYQKEGLQPTKRIKAATDAYVEEQDVVGTFIGEAFEFRSDGRLLPPDIQLALATFLWSSGVEKKVTKTHVRRVLHDAHGVKDDFYKSKRALTGVNIKPDFWSLIGEYARKRPDISERLDRFQDETLGRTKTVAAKLSKVEGEGGVEE